MTSSLSVPSRVAANAATRWGEAAPSLRPAQAATHLALAVIVLTSAVIGASYLPARIDPMEALRYE